MRVVLVGGSGHGFNHLQVWRKLPGLTRLTVVGRDTGRLAELAAQYEVATSLDLAAALREADLVDIATPTDTHFDLARQAVAAGVPTIVEKPACRTVAEAEALAAEAGSTPLACVLNYRCSPVWLRARELVAWGAIGRPLLSMWPVLADNRHLMVGDGFRADAARGGGALLDGAFHIVGLMPWVLGTPMRAVTAWLGRLASAPPAGEDTAMAIYEHDGGAAQLTYSWAVPNPARMPAATLIGTDATLLVPRSAKQPIELIRDRETSEVDLGEYRTWPRNDLGNALTRFADNPAAAAGETWAAALEMQRMVEQTELAASTGARVVLG